MPLQEGHTYLHGRLGGEWGQKFTAKGDELYENSLAYQPKKEDETIWVDLTIWPSDLSGTAWSEAVAAACGKGNIVLVRGVVKTRTYFSKKHNEDRVGYSMSVYDLGVKPRYEQQSSGSRAPDEGAESTASARAALEHARRPFDLQEDEEPF